MSDSGSPFDPDGKDTRSRLRDSLHQGLSALADHDDDSYQPSVEDRIRGLGFGGDAARAFDLLPLVLVAWADGSVQPDERATILDVLRLRGLAGGDAYAVMEALLEERPAEVYLDTALTLLRDLLAEREVDASSIVDLCIDVAAAAAAYVGADPISDEEREAIAKVAAVLGEDSAEDIYRRLA
jgi:tellurite resistance protein